MADTRGADGAACLSPKTEACGGAMAPRRYAQKVTTDKYFEIDVHLSQNGYGGGARPFFVRNGMAVCQCLDALPWLWQDVSRILCGLMRGEPIRLDTDDENQHVHL